MNSHLEQHNDLYHNLGKLFYAFASCDKHIRVEEYDVLEQHISRYWVKIDKQAIKILNTFKDPNLDVDDSDRYFRDFLAFKNANENVFTEELKSTILKTAQAICASVNSVNKSELILLARLSMNFKD